MKRTNHLRNFYVSMVVIFVIVTILSSGALALGITNRCEEYMLKETSALVSADATQLKLNINAYLDSIVGNVALMFASDEHIAYDATTTVLDEYGQINMEDSIEDRIVDLGALENYSDFCVVYSNDKIVGWESKTTQNMYSKSSIYQDMSSCITNEKTQDGWAFGVQDNYDRMYYVKRYNENAVIITSFYTRELERSFEYPEELKGMTVRLVDNNGYIVYSSDQDEIGQIISEGEFAYIDLGYDSSVVTEEQLINTGHCDNGWTVMCIVSRDTIMNEFKNLRRFAYWFSGFIIVGALIILAILVSRATKPMDGYVDDLSEKATMDELSGVLNRRGFTELVTQALEKKIYKEIAFIMFDVDNFKKINDTLGHDCGDNVIARMGALLSRTFVNKSGMEVAIGRLGGDEFAVFIGLKKEAQKELVFELMDHILIAFEEEFQEERKQIPLSLSGGLTIEADSESSYQMLYMNADTALYKSKESGKNQYNVYQEGAADEN